MLYKNVEKKRKEKKIKGQLGKCFEELSVGLFLCSDE